MTPAQAMTEEQKIKLLAALLMSEPWTLVACGLGDITGAELAERLLVWKPKRK